jgi:starch synthase
MKVLFVASEMAPYVKTGGLGDVVGSLPKALRQMGVDARVVIPHYSMIHQAEHRLVFRVPRRQGDGDAYVSEGRADGDVPVYFLRSWPYFVDDGKIYTVWDWDTPRFIYFAQMAAAFIWQLAQGALDEGDPWWPDLVHVHDWHTGLLPFLLHEARFNPGWQDMASLMTIHNMGFQGPYASKWLYEEGIRNRDHYALPWQDWRDNLLAIGIAYSNKINTVSPNHAHELHYPRFGEGLEGVLWARDADFSGIVNGIDTETLDPATDPHIAQNFDAKTFRQLRWANKLALQRELNLPEDPNIPLIAFVGRLTAQKGVDFMIPALYDILTREQVQFVGLGSGDSYLESGFGQIGLHFSSKARTYLRYDFALAQRIYAGADMMLVPSRYEPCGLTQIIAMRYGCIPIVRETGGLVDTVENYDDAEAEFGTGFRFLFEEAGALSGTIRWALYTYHQRQAAWERIQERGLQRDASWAKSGQAYIDLYQAAIDQKRAWRKG